MGQFLRWKCQYEKLNMLDSWYILNTSKLQTERTGRSLLNVIVSNSKQGIKNSTIEIQV